MSGLTEIILKGLQETTSTIQGILRGFRDSLQGICAIRKINEPFLDKNETLRDRVNDITILGRRRQRQEAEGGIRTSNRQPEKKTSLTYRLMECCSLNAVVICFSIYFFEVLMHLFDRYFSVSPSWLYFKIMFDVIFKIFWVLPVLFLTRIINICAFQDIAERTSRHFGGRHRELPVAVILTDFMFSSVVQMIFMVQAFVFGLFCPPWGLILNIVHNALLNSLYTFEYKWYDEGVNAQLRVYRIERRWPYYLGFGLPLALSQHFASTFLNLPIAMGLYSTLFPFFIISAHAAKTNEVKESFRVPFFKPTFYLSKHVFRRVVP